MARGRFSQARNGAGLKGRAKARRGAPGWMVGVLLLTSGRVGGAILHVAGDRF